jgi:hypothetical protein
MADEDELGSDRRRGERVLINNEFADLDPNSTTYVSDLSEHGVFVHTRQRLSIGTTIELRFTVLLDDPVSIQGLGKVVRHHPEGMGVEFGPLSPITVLRIHDVLSRQRPRPSGEPLAHDTASQIVTREFRTRRLSEEAFEQARTGAFAALTDDAGGDDDAKTRAHPSLQALRARRQIADDTPSPSPPRPKPKSED